MANKNKVDSGWIDVKSSNVRRIRWLGSPINKLFVQFHSGGGGCYVGVDRQIFWGIKRAASKGKFVHRVLIPNHAWIKGATP